MILFDVRNRMKKYLHTQKDAIYINERDVWYVHLGVNIGYEQNGSGEHFKRPVLVLKRLGNMFFVVPLTTGGKDNDRYILLPAKYFNKVSRAIVSQVRCLDKKRFTHKVSRIDTHDFLLIKEKLRTRLF